VNRSIAKLEGAIIYLAASRVNTDVFRLSVIGTHTAECSQAKPAVSFDFTNHPAERICMCLEQKSLAASAEVGNNAALFRHARRKSECLKFIPHPFCGFFRKARGAVYPYQFYRFFRGKIRIFSFKLHFVPPMYWISAI